MKKSDLDNWWIMGHNVEQPEEKRPPDVKIRYCSGSAVTENGAGSNENTGRSSTGFRTERRKEVEDYVSGNQTECSRGC